MSMPVTGAVAEYRGSRYRVLFGNSEWYALRVDRDVEIPDAIARGERRLPPAPPFWAALQPPGPPVKPRIRKDLPLFCETNPIS